MAGHDIVVVGASAGGLEPLKTLAGGLPDDLPAAVFVVMHVPAEGSSMLPLILRGAGPLPADHAADGLKIEMGRIYVAPPDRHMTLDDGTLHVSRGPKENNFRPAVDPLFRSAALSYGPRVVGVVLSGALSDGAMGLQAINHAGGVTIVQDPEEALFPSMPRSALDMVDPDYTLPVHDIPSTVTKLAQEPVKPAAPEAVMKKREEGAPSVFTCPDCHGTLWELRDGELLQYRCRVGHGYSADSLRDAQDESTERALWAALRSLEESAALSRRLAAEARHRNQNGVAERFNRKGEEREKHAAVLRRLLSE